MYYVVTRLNGVVKKDIMFFKYRNFNPANILVVIFYK